MPGVPATLYPQDTFVEQYSEMIEFKHLKLVEAIEQKGSLSQAAKDLNLSQSALSHQLKQLEEYLDVRVFHRIKNRLVFTEAGREFYEYGKDILSNVEELEDRMLEFKRVRENKYVHGYSSSEVSRLYDQASTVADFIHWDSYWSDGSRILEAGCGVGAQTRIIAAKNPTSEIVAVDVSKKSLEKARQLINEESIGNVVFQPEDLRKLSFATEEFDHVFVCFVLEHVEGPDQILSELKRVLKKGGSITVVEGDHGSTYFYPDSEAARKAVEAQVVLQRKNGGNANIGRELYPLLARNGFERIASSPRQIYVDQSKPKLIDGFIRKTFVAMIEGVAEKAIAEGIISQADMRDGIRDLHKVAEEEGVFCYTFFKATGLKPV